MPYARVSSTDRPKNNDHTRWEHKQARLGAGLGMLAAVVAIGVVVSGAQALAEWRDGRLPVPGTALSSASLIEPASPSRPLTRLQSTIAKGERQ